MTALEVVFCLLACVLLASASEVDGDDYIVGGSDAARNRFPWIVSLRTLQNHHFCGAFILSDRWIGSAASCTQGQWGHADRIIAAVGAHRRTDGTRHLIARVQNHPQFNPNTMTYDISILQTVERIAVTAQGPIRTIRFPTGPVIRDGQIVNFAGWGLTRVCPRTPRIVEL